MESPIRPGEVIDGYEIIRRIGSGGFGTVWLCRARLTGDYRALKFISGDAPDVAGKEKDALISYRQAARQLHSPHLMPIEHVNSLPLGLFYVMPLADGYGAEDPADEAWHPWTLATMIEHRRGQAAWFSHDEVAALICPVLDGLQTLLDAGFVHRDVKPENILFISGHPCLADISLLGEDAQLVTRRGTPGYSAPSWYVDAGGHADMFGAAATLYTLLTGNPPDKIGKAHFRWPPQGEGSLTPDEHREWLRLHCVVLRATEERPANRFMTYAAFSQAVMGGKQPPTTRPRRAAIVAGALLLAAILGTIAFFVIPRGKPEPPTQVKVTTSGLTESEEADYRATASLAAMYFDEKSYQDALELLNQLLETYPVARQNSPLYSTLRARCLFALDRKEEAREELKVGLATGPIDAANFSQRIQLWQDLGELENAEAEADRILREMRPITLYYMLRASIRLQRGNFDGVEEDIQLASTLDDDPGRAGMAEKLRVGFADRSLAYAEYLRGRGLLAQDITAEVAVSPTPPSAEHESTSAVVPPIFFPPTYQGYPTPPSSDANEPVSTAASLILNLLPSEEEMKADPRLLIADKLAAIWSEEPKSWDEFLLAVTALATEMETVVQAYRPFQNLRKVPEVYEKLISQAKKDSQRKQLYAAMEQYNAAKWAYKERVINRANNQLVPFFARAEKEFGQLLDIRAYEVSSNLEKKLDGFAPPPADSSSKASLTASSASSDELARLLLRVPAASRAENVSAPSIPASANFLERIKFHFKNDDYDGVERELQAALSMVEDAEQRALLLQAFRAQSAHSIPFYGEYLKQQGLLTPAQREW